MKKRIVTQRPNIEKEKSAAESSRRSSKPILVVAVILVVAAVVVIALWRRDSASAPSGPPEDSAAMHSRGEALAHIYCQMCHLFPEPSALNRMTWAEHVLPDMKARLGLNPTALDGHPEIEQLKATGAFPERPKLSIDEWNLIESYYMSNAPELQPAGKLEKIEVQVPGFEVELPAAPRGSPTTTLTFIDEKHGEMLLGNATLSALQVFDSTNQLRQTIPMDNVPVSVWPVDAGIYVTSIGTNIAPSVIPRGSLSFLPRQGDSYGPAKVLFSELPRSLQSAFGDINGDGRSDLVISMFGHVVGRFSWFENVGEDTFKEHVLKNRPGTIQTALKDMNGDGFLDILALTAAETESLEIFYNNGKGEFTSKMIFQKPPYFAHTHFEMADFNGDGKEDLAVSNGATGEWFTSTLKAFHGLRIYLNKGDDRFEEAFFFRMNGAYQFDIGDFDEDGDMDIAAVSYYPDYRKASAESFVYLQNNGSGLSFQAFTFPEVLAGRWITVDAGDLDKDGDLDIVLGSKFNGPSSVPKVLKKNWEDEGPAFVVLRNRLR